MRKAHEIYLSYYLYCQIHLNFIYNSGYYDSNITTPQPK